MSLLLKGFPCGSVGKESACNEGGLGSIPGLERSPGEGKGYPLPCSGLENPMDCIVHGVAESQTGLKDFQFSKWPPVPYFYHSLIKPMSRSLSLLIVSWDCVPGTMLKAVHTWIH